MAFTSYNVGGHRPSNGHTWVEILAQEMNLAKWAKPAYRDPAFGNYAYADMFDIKAAVDAGNMGAAFAIMQDVARRPSRRKQTLVDAIPDRSCVIDERACRPRSATGNLSQLALPQTRSLAFALRLHPLSLEIAASGCRRAVT